MGGWVCDKTKAKQFNSGFGQESLGMSGHINIGVAYQEGKGVEKDSKKANYCLVWKRT